MLIPIYLVVGLINIFAKNRNYNIKTDDKTMDIRVRRSLGHLEPILGTNVYRQKRGFSFSNIFSGSRTYETSPSPYKNHADGTVRNTEDGFNTGINNTTYNSYQNTGIESDSYNNRYENIGIGNNVYNNSYRNTGFTSNDNWNDSAPVYYNYHNPNSNFAGYFGHGNGTQSSFNAGNTSYNYNHTAGHYSKQSATTQIPYVSRPTLSPLFQDAVHGSARNNELSNSDRMLNNLLNTGYYQQNFSNINNGFNIDTNVGLPSSKSYYYPGADSYFSNNNGNIRSGAVGPNFRSDFKSDLNGFESKFSNNINTGNYPYNTQHRSDVYSNTGSTPFNKFGNYGTHNSYINQNTGSYYSSYRNTGFNPYGSQNSTQNRFNILPAIDKNNPYDTKGAPVFPYTGTSPKRSDTNAGIADEVKPNANNTVKTCVICNIPCPSFMKRLGRFCVDNDY